MELDKIHALKNFYEEVEKIFFDKNFYLLYSLKYNKNDLEIIRKKLLSNEEYEKIIIIDNLIKNKLFELGKETKYDINDINIKMTDSDIIQSIVALFNSEDLETQIFKESEKLYDIIISLLNKRIFDVKCRKIILFENDSKLMNMFEYFRSDALKYYEKQKNHINKIKPKL
jgi:hypothetical protein